MKKIILSGLILIALLSSQNVSAINGQEFGLSHGSVTHNAVSDVAASVAVAVFSLGYVEVDNLDFSGSFNLHYTLRPLRKLGVGAVLSYERSNGDVVCQRKICGTVKNTYLSVMPTLSFSWFDFKFVGMYSKVGLSYTFMKSKYNYFDSSAVDNDADDKANDGELWFQFSPVAIEGGLPNLKAFAEFGFGTQGLVNLGIKYKF